MKKRTLNTAIKRARNELAWPILDNPGEAPVYRVFSDPLRQSHVVHVPADAEARNDDLHYLHELGHATLCERVHPAFAANSFLAAATVREQFIALAPALQAASDWFVGSWMHGMTPGRFRKSLEEELAAVEKIFSCETPPPIDVFLDAALVVAQAITFLDAPIDCGGKLKEAVDAFLSVKADNPSADAIIQLANDLMAIYTPLRARLANDGEYDVWEVYLSGEETSVAA